MEKMVVTHRPRVLLRTSHRHQALIEASRAKRKVVRAGRRGGKTVVAATIAVDGFLCGRRVLYAAPTIDQVETFWREVKRALKDMLDAGVLYKNESSHIIEVTEGYKNASDFIIEGEAGQVKDSAQRIRAKTAWNADTLRGDYADLLILDEFQLMNEDTWGVVGAPMLLDNDGDAIFIYTPPSLHSKSITKARDPRHAAKLFKAAQEDKTGRWEAFHFSSLENPHISHIALAEISKDMTQVSYRQEILAEDIEDVPGALWTRNLIEGTRVEKAPDLIRVIVGVDPPGGGTECGIVTAGVGLDGHGYVIDDRSIMASPNRWGGAVVDAYFDYMADRIVGEANYGGDMVENTIVQVAKARELEVAYYSVQASRGKAIRAEPIAALYEQGRVHHVGEYPLMEEELCMWVPGITKASPNRLDALVWALTELMLGEHDVRLRYL